LKLYSRPCTSTHATKSVPAVSAWHTNAPSVARASIAPPALTLGLLIRPPSSQPPPPAHQGHDHRGSHRAYRSTQPDRGAVDARDGRACCRVACRTEAKHRMLSTLNRMWTEDFSQLLFMHATMGPADLFLRLSSRQREPRLSSCQREAQSLEPHLCFAYALNSRSSMLRVRLPCCSRHPDIAAPNVGLQVFYSPGSHQRLLDSFILDSSIVHVDQSYGIKVDPDKVSAIQALPMPRNIVEIRSFLGATNWFPEHLPRYAACLAPLRAAEASAR
jgi:hypothetical protein